MFRMNRLAYGMAAVAIVGGAASGAVASGFQLKEQGAVIGPH